MINLSKIAVIALLTLFSIPASAQIVGGELETLLVNILIFVNNVLIPFIIGIGFLFFVWGIFLYFILGGADEEKRAQGRSLVVHATLGFVLIIIFWGVVNMFSSSTGLDNETLENIPEVILP